MKRLISLQFLIFGLFSFNLLGMQQPLTPETTQSLNNKLVSAVKIDNLDWIRRLIAQGAQAHHIIRSTVIADRPLLVEAISNSQNPEVIKLLLDKGADPNIGIHEQATPIYSLISRFIHKRKLTETQFVQMLSYLFAAGATINESAQKLIDTYKIQPLVDIAQSLKRKIL